ncbi:MAG TPA: efflux RND transporter periplasmic adaptor subunit [Roseiarcus sp.]|jgi:RND family efflux transporter MFP subunit
MNEGVESNTEEARKKPRGSAKLGFALFVLVLGAGSVAAWGVVSRRNDEAKLSQWTLERAIPTVAIVSPKLGGAPRDLVLPGDVEAYYNAVVRAQVSGYVRQWYKDIGANVKTGDLLAVVDTPELDQRLAESREQLTKAKANQAFAAVTAGRWKSLRQSGAVSQQTADEKAADEQEREAEVAAASANVDRLKALKAFANIVAPFDGVVTQRNIDVGSLVNESANASAGLFVVADTHEMRVYVKAPQSYAADLHQGMKAKLVLPQYPGRSFEAVISTTARAIDQRSRTLLVELVAKNEDGALPPGAFAEVHFEVPTPAEALRLPAGAMIFRNQSVEVATVGPDNRVVMKNVEIGRDYGPEVAIASGLSAGDRVIASPPDSLEAGDEVHIRDSANQVVQAGRSAE